MAFLLTHAYPFMSRTVITTLLAAFLPIVSHAGEKPAQPAPTADRKVRIVYLVSKDRKEDPRYTAAIEHAIKDLQGWYATQLGGPTFHLSDPVVEVVQSEREAKWFTETPNEGSRPDDRQFNNTLAEARKLCGTRWNDPSFTWVIYSDSPGHSGRGGNGITCLPEDDLLGLIGKHPTQKDKRRWIAGLGHELGHAFGLPHPADTTKHADALMWAGIYGKYPDKAYLTDQDKAILMKSRFFYHPDGKPVADETGKEEKAKSTEKADSK